MYKHEHFDSILKSSLDQGSNSLFVTQKMFDNIISEFKTKKHKRTMPFFLTKKAIPIAISCALIVSFFFILSPQAKVWAAEGINKIYLVISGENGYKVEEQDVLRIINGNDDVKYVINEVVTKDTVDTYVVGYYKPNLESTKLTGEKLNKYLGYNIKLPELLMDGFKLKNKSVIKKKSLLLAVYENQYKILLVTSNILQPSSLNTNSTVKIGDRDGIWFETPIAVNKDGEVIFDPAQKPDKVKTNHILSWEENGVYYSLMDTGNNLPLEKAIDFAKSIINLN